MLTVLLLLKGKGKETIKYQILHLDLLYNYGVLPKVGVKK